jgi:hypothetical protein
MISSIPITFMRAPLFSEAMNSRLPSHSIKDRTRNLWSTLVSDFALAIEGFGSWGKRERSETGLRMGVISKRAGELSPASSDRTRSGRYTSNVASGDPLTARRWQVASGKHVARIG